MPRFQGFVRSAVAGLLLLVPLAATSYGQDASIVERNRAAARQMLERAWFKGDSDAAAGFFADRYVSNDAARGFGVSESADVQTRVAQDWCRQRGDCSKSEIHLQVAEGDTVATYWTLRMQPHGGLNRTLATLFGQVPMQRRMVSIARFDAGGKIVELSSLRDDLGILSDLGYTNLAFLLTFALGGALGMTLMWFTVRMTRRRA